MRHAAERNRAASSTRTKKLRISREGCRTRRKTPDKTEKANQVVPVYYVLDIKTPFYSPWTSDIVIARKRREKRCWCGFRQLVDVSVKDVFPRRIDKILLGSGKPECFTGSECCLIFLAVPLQYREQQKTIVTSELGSFEWKTIPIVLCSTRATSQKAIDRILASV